MLTLLGWFALLLLGGALIAFWNEVKDWVEEVLDDIRYEATKAVAYIQRIPGGVKEMIYYIKNGHPRVIEGNRHKDRPMSNEEIDKMVKRGFLTKEQGEKLKRGEDIEIGNWKS